MPYSDPQQRKDYQKELKQSRRDKGLCAKCGINPLDSPWYCNNCIARTEELRRIRRNANLEEKRTAEREQSAKFREKCRAKGVCPSCGVSPSLDGFTKCEVCRSKENIRRNTLQQERIIEGLCKRCGKYKYPIESVSFQCPICFLKYCSRTLGYIVSWTELDDLFQQQNVCPYTGIKLTLAVNASIDHIVPKAKGGLNDIENLQWVYRCKEFDINHMKCDYLHDDFLEAVKVIYEYNFNLQKH